VLMFKLVKIVFKYEGVVDKYIGDALMAVFGTLEEEVNPEYRAVAACLEFKTAIKDMNDERIANNMEPISIGVGVNTGKIISIVFEFI
jgi:class 3 adenylate cyclase